MSTSDWQKVYRGVPYWRMQWVGSPWDSDARPSISTPQGIHWSSDPIVAYHFATQEGSGAANAALHHPDSREPSTSGVVLEGWAHRKNIIVPGSDEWEDLADKHGILRSDSHEQEVTLRPGSTVKASKAHLIGEQFGHPGGVSVLDLVTKPRNSNVPLFRSIPIHPQSR